jgi:cell division protein ZapA (FtsZ GTPase activity inhibitor)
MSETIKVNIAGMPYSLKVDNVELTNQAVELLNQQIEYLINKQKSDLPPSARTVIAALNIAEENIITKNESDDLSQYLISEINQMTSILNKKLENLTKVVAD